MQYFSRVRPEFMASVWGLFNDIPKLINSYDNSLLTRDPCSIEIIRAARNGNIDFAAPFALKSYTRKTRLNQDLKSIEEARDFLSPLVTDSTADGELTAGCVTESQAYARSVNPQRYVPGAFDSFDDEYRWEVVTSELQLLSDQHRHEGIDVFTMVVNAGHHHPGAAANLQKFLTNHPDAKDTILAYYKETLNV